VVAWIRPFTIRTGIAAHALIGAALRHFRDEQRHQEGQVVARQIVLKK
jgi:hypothetical protein